LGNFGPLAKLVTEVGSGQVAAGHPVSLGELVDRWPDDIGPRRAAWTMQYRELANRSVKPAVGSLRLDRLWARQLDDFYKGLSQQVL
jgi:hypothetical protein